MNVRIRVALALACSAFVMPLLGGCSLTAPAARTGEISHADVLAIKEAVLKDLFDFQKPKLHPWRPGISAYVIDDPADGSELARDFTGHHPPVTAGPAIVNDADENLDAATGKPVEVYAVRIRQISCDHATVGAGWRSATLVGIWYTYDLQRVKGVWMVKKRAVVGVS
ncbi:MAG TPA: hypothetical protein VFE47_02300 [Tepidisphaeraceae bacterium]|jgi:hypothetical protein|nr:hypothetical protein [Tepidisphaeraceae bacterium]